MKKVKKSTIKKKLEKLCNQIVKERDDYTCQWCGKKVEGSNCHASHIIPKSHCGRLRYNPLNLKVLCYNCHIHKWHKDPIRADEWIKEKFPERIKELKKLDSEYSKMGTIHILEYQEMLDKLKGDK